MTAPAAFTQYSTIDAFLGTAPGWVPAVDQQRIAAYQAYEEIYWASEEGFQEVLRGDNENPVMMPTARTIVNCVNRYTAPDFGFNVQALQGTEDTSTTTDSTTVQVARLAFDALFTREQFFSKFQSNKLKGIRQGDWLWHIIADPNKPLGRRLKIMRVEPGSYFPVYEADLIDGGDPDKIVKVHLAETIIVDRKELISRMTYERLFDANGNQTGIQRSHGIYDAKDWSTLNPKPVRTVLSPELLPAAIPAIPVYHLKNVDPTDPFGSSEMRGLESVLLGINQTVSDEDAALALDGIGIYATDGGAPRDDQGNEVDWIFGPGRVLTHAGGLTRVNGTSSVAPFGDHYERMFNAVRQAVGASDVAMGKVDSSTAESGVALLIELAPILAYTKEKDQHIFDVHAQMFHDMCFWLAEYEELDVLLQTGEGGETVPSVQVLPTIGDKIPKNIKAVVELVIALRTAVPPIVSLATSHRLLREAGLDLDDDELNLILRENEQQLANFDGQQDDANADDRTDVELNADEGANA